MTNLIGAIYEQWLTVPGATDSGGHDPAKNA
jgi:hypothetical protein